MTSELDFTVPTDERLRKEAVIAMAREIYIASIRADYPENFGFVATDSITAAEVFHKAQVEYLKEK